LIYKNTLLVGGTEMRGSINVEDDSRGITNYTGLKAWFFVGVRWQRSA
jgi:hypothetical protein